MRRDAFISAQRAYIRRADGGYETFVPPSLPPKLDLEPGLVQRLSEADRALGLLSGVAHSLTSPYLLSQSFLRREAVLSSRIEGTEATLSDLVLFEADNIDHTGDSREVANYMLAMEQALRSDRELPVSLRLLRQMHKTLLTDTRGSNATPGEFRRQQVWIGSKDCRLEDARYVPPAPESLMECLDAFEKYVHRPHPVPLIDLAYLHYQFEAIHPFLDGNGRLGRLLIALLLCEWDLLPTPLLDISGFFEPHREAYYERLFAVSSEGDWNGWVEYFLTAVAVQAKGAVERAKNLRDLRDHYREQVTSAGSSVLLSALVDHFFNMPALTVRQAEHRLDVSYRTASKCVDKLVEAGIVNEVTGRARDRIYVAQEILTLLTKP